MSVIGQFDPWPILDWQCKQDVPGLSGWLIVNKAEMDRIMGSLMSRDCHVIYIVNEV